MTPGGSFRAMPFVSPLVSRRETSVFLACSPSWPLAHPCQSSLPSLCLLPDSEEFIHLPPQVASSRHLAGSIKVKVKTTVILGNERTSALAVLSAGLAALKKTQATTAKVVEVEICILGILAYKTSDSSFMPWFPYVQNKRKLPLMLSSNIACVFIDSFVGHLISIDLCQQCRLKGPWLQFSSPDLV